MSLLDWLIVAPIVGSVSCLVLKTISKILALGFSIVGIALVLLVYQQFDPTNTQMQMISSLPWIKHLGIQYAVGVDGLSLLLVVLTKLMMPIVILCSWNEKRNNSALIACFFILDAAMTGTFLATDIFLFYVFWELMLIPMLLIIGVWGSKQRIYAAIKFFLYTFAGSVLMLVAIFWLFCAHLDQAGFFTGNIAAFESLVFSETPVFLGLTSGDLVFLGFLIAFAIKVPLFPVHTWLPDAHVQAPTGGSVLLAAVLLKMGTYGILRFCIPITPEAFVRFVPLMATLSLIGIIYGAWVAFQQSDMKKLIAYSSISHLGFVVLGICAMNSQALSGSLIQMLNHGISTGALFLLVGFLYERYHTRDMNHFGGLASVLPWYAFFLVFVSCSSMGVPGLNGFVGEFLILLGTAQANLWWAAVGTLGVLFAAVYMLTVLKRVLFGKTPEGLVKKEDLTPREWTTLVPLAGLILLLGIYPSPILKKVRPTMDAYWKKIEKRIGSDGFLSQASMAGDHS